MLLINRPNSKTATVSAHVGVGGIAIAPMTQFDTVSVEQYFEQFLGGSAGAATEPAPAATDAAAPAAAPAPTTPPPAGNP